MLRDTHATYGVLVLVLLPLLRAPHSVLHKNWNVWTSGVHALISCELITPFRCVLRELVLALGNGSGSYPVSGALEKQEHVWSLPWGLLRTITTRYNILVVRLSGSLWQSESSRT